MVEKYTQTQNDYLQKKKNKLTKRKIKKLITVKYDFNLVNYS